MARTQADYRRDINAKDQFGRKWCGQIEIATADLCGHIGPAGWSDPLRTPQQYVRLAKNEEGQTELGRCAVNFAVWIRDFEHAEMEWYTQLHKNALHVYKSIDPATVGKLEQDKFLLDLTGRRPWPSVKVLKQARDGHKGYLGLAPLTVEERAALGMQTLDDLKAGPMVEAVAAPPVTDDHVPPDNYQDFVSWAFRKGSVQPGDLKAAAALWQDHRRNLAEVA